MDEAQKSLGETQAALTEARANLEDLQASRDHEVQRLEQELDQAWADRDSAARE